MDTMKTYNELYDERTELDKEMCMLPLCDELLNIYVRKVMIIMDQIEIKRLYNRIITLSEQKQKVIITFEGKDDILDIAIRELDAKMNEEEKQIIILKRKTYDVFDNRELSYIGNCFFEKF